MNNNEYRRVFHIHLRNRLFMIIAAPSLCAVSVIWLIFGIESREDYYYTAYVLLLGLGCLYYAFFLSGKIILSDDALTYRLISLETTLRFDDIIEPAIVDDVEKYVRVYDKYDRIIYLYPQIKNFNELYDSLRTKKPGFFPSLKKGNLDTLSVKKILCDNQTKNMPLFIRMRPWVDNGLFIISGIFIFYVVGIDKVLRDYGLGFLFE